MKKSTSYGYTNEKVNNVCERIIRILDLTSKREHDPVVGVNIAFHGFVKAAYRLSRTLGRQVGGDTSAGIEELMRAITEMDNYVKMAEKVGDED
jgi:hypothetical protein